jgi:Na+/H+-dicarboxylate symporter
MSRHFTWLILIAMILGLGTGWLAHDNLGHGEVTELAGYLGLVTWVFLTLIKMVIAPLVFSTLTSGVAHMGGGAAAGRVGFRTIGWFIIAGIISLGIGLAMASVLQPGVGLHLPPPPPEASAVKADLTLKGFLSHVIPTSILDAMAKNEVLEIVVFSLFVGTAIGQLGPRAAGVLDLLGQVAAVMLKVTEFVMTVAPLAVFSAIAATVAMHGVEVIATYARFVGGFYLSLATLWVLLLAAGAVSIGRRLPGLLAAIRQPALIAFSTASSEAAYPGLLEGLQRFGISRRVASFVLPLGYSFNLDGSMMYTTFASLFIAQLYGIDLSLGQKLTMGAMLMITSKGIASVPRASLVVIAAILPYFHIPEAGLLLVLGVDQFLDMGRSGTNVIGNSIAAAAVAGWEGELGPPLAADADVLS